MCACLCLCVCVWMGDCQLCINSAVWHCAYMSRYFYARTDLIIVITVVQVSLEKRGLINHYLCNGQYMFYYSWLTKRKKNPHHCLWFLLEFKLSIILSLSLFTCIRVSVCVCSCMSSSLSWSISISINEMMYYVSVRFSVCWIGDRLFLIFLPSSIVVVVVVVTANTIVNLFTADYC